MSYTEAIIDNLNSGMYAKDVAEKVGCSLPSVYAVAQRTGVKIRKHKSQLAEHHDEVVELRANAVSTKEIGKMFGVSSATVKWYCRRHGIKGIPSRGQNRNTEGVVAKNIRDRNADLEYLDGYRTKESKVRCRCRKCGTVFERTYHAIVHKHITSCPECSRMESEKRKAKAEAEQEDRERKRLTKKLIRLLEHEVKEKSKVHRCPVCGKGTTRPKYCSDRCQRRATDKAKEIRRRTRIQDRMVDKDITLESLFKRDRGVCHICGGKCDYEDYVVRDTTIICGDWYPSIDHVVPLSKGGEHSWANVKLAHRSCNSRKGNRCNR